MGAARFSASEAGSKLRWLAHRLRFPRAYSTAARTGAESAAPSAIKPARMERSSTGGGGASAAPPAAVVMSGDPRRKI